MFFVVVISVILGQAQLWSYVVGLSAQ